MRNASHARPVHSSLGAHWDGQGVHFAVFSQHAEKMDLILFDPKNPAQEPSTVSLTRDTQGVWSTYVDGVQPDCLYNFRADGPFDAGGQQVFDSSKLLLDPYAKALEGPKRWHPSMQSVDPDSGEPMASATPSARFVPRCRVIDPSYQWRHPRRLRIPWSDTVLYETHVKGMTQRHPEVPSHLRGTYLGLCQPPILSHLRDLGITAIDLMPVHEFIDERHLVQKELSNYWGYATIGFFAPTQRYATKGGDPVLEFKQMVDTLHGEGFEVIIDVVFNHSGEGSWMGPTLVFRGIDQSTYYRFDQEGNPIDVTGCGNTLDISEPQFLRLTLDSLRYWVLEMGVDGFRFDLATTLGRDPDSFRQGAPFFMSLFQDPVLSQVKCIAEPWDIGHHGYQLGSFPSGWAEWNGKYRDDVRSFWSPSASPLADLATRMAGSSDLFSQRGPHASINFITAHDGFTLEDLVSYNQKHNERNQEQNRDGHNDNRSHNWGIEGQTDDETILADRDRAKRNMIATLALSLGVPMLCHGDERNRTQLGNNNAYCLDDETTWVNWTSSPRQEQFQEFVTQAFKIRRQFPALSRDRHFRPSAGPDTGVQEISWITPQGVEFEDPDWSREQALGAIIPHPRSPAPLSHQEKEVLMILINGSEHPISFLFPDEFADHHWEVLLDSGTPAQEPRTLEAKTTLPPYSLQCLFHSKGLGDDA